MGVCSRVAFNRCLRSGREPGPDAQLSLEHARLGRVPVRVYQPRGPSAGLRAGAIFLLGGGRLYCSTGRAGRAGALPPRRSALPPFSPGGGGLILPPELADGLKRG